MDEGRLERLANAMHLFNDLCPPKRIFEGHVTTLNPHRTTNIELDFAWWLFGPGVEVPGELEGGSKRILHEKGLRFKLSGDETYYTACSLPAISKKIV